MPPLALLFGVAIIAAGVVLYKRSRGRNPGSPTTASDAVDDIHVPPQPTHDEVLDAGVKGTFPASDPVSSKPSETAYEKQQRLKRSLTPSA